MRARIRLTALLVAACTILYPASDARSEAIIFAGFSCALSGAELQHNFTTHEVNNPGASLG